MDSESLHFDRLEVLIDPYPLYRRLREEAPVHWDDAQQGWVVTRYDHVLAALRDDDAYSAQADMSFMDALPPGLREEAEPLRQHFGSWIVFSDPPKHTRLRSLTQGYLMPEAITAVRGKLEERAARLLDEAERAGRFDALNDFAVPVAMLVLADLIGIEEDDLAQANRWSEELLQFINVELEIEQTHKSLAKLMELTEFIRGLEGQGKLRPDTLAWTLSRAHAEGKVDAIEVVATYAQNITGSLGPVPHIISNGLLALLEHPDQLALLRGDPGLIRTAVQEFLRYDTPFLIVPRTARLDTELGGVPIKAGHRLGLMVGAANHDPAVFTAPERLDVTRHPNPHLAFGIGAHYCLGVHVTRLVAEVAVAMIVSRFPNLRLAGPAERQPFFGMRLLKSLPLAVGAEGAERRT